MRLVWGTIAEVASSHEDAQRITVSLDTGETRPALAYPALCGPCTAGERVLVNATALDLALGTGGVDIVLARTAAGSAPEGIALDDPSGGHIMKLRYTPLQRDVLAVEEEASQHHDSMMRATDLGGMPVVCCGLHSQVAPAAAAVKEASPAARVAFVMSDEATLALPMSDTIRDCRAAGLVDVSISSGQAFGGDLEAVNLYSALLAARHAAGAQLAIVAIGPGVAGTGTPLGHGGVAQGIAINAAASLAGRPIAALRLSFADSRQRHRGVSHHTLTALARVALASCRVAVPRLDREEAAQVDSQLDSAGVWESHTRADVARRPGELPDLRGVTVTTMGRGPADDPVFFAAAAAAGDVAAALT